MSQSWRIQQEVCHSALNRIKFNLKTRSVYCKPLVVAHVCTMSLSRISEDESKTKGEISSFPLRLSFRGAFTVTDFNRTGKVSHQSSKFGPTRETGHRLPGANTVQDTGDEHRVVRVNDTQTKVHDSCEK